MRAAERTVLHVLPHPGGGGETYVDLLDEMDGYRFERAYLAHSPGVSPVVARGVAHVLRRAGRYDLLHVHGEVAAGLCLPRLAQRRSIVTLHGLHLVRRLGGARRTGAMLNLRATLRAADRTICISQSERDELARIVGEQAARCAVVVRNGVHRPPPGDRVEREAVRDELGIRQDEVVGIWVGSLDERKDPLTAIDAAEQAGVRLLVVGDGPLRSRVERAAGDHALVLGQREDVPRLLAGSDFYVLTSRREGLALSLLEAMAYGLPAATTDIAESVEATGDTGFAVPVGDPGALAAGMRRLAEDDGERAALGERARQRVADHFDAASMIVATRAIYDDVLAD